MTTAPDRPQTPAVTGAPRPAPAIQSALRWSIVDGLLHAVMLGVSESYLGAFAVELGHNDTALALLATLPPLCGALSQLLAPLLALHLGSRKRLVVAGAALQGLSHVGFAAIALSQSSNLFWLLLAKTGFWISGMVIAPPWNAWIGSLTEGVERARYFLRRTMACHMALLVSFLLAGQYLQRGRPLNVLSHFAVLFAVGLVARCLAAFALHRQSDPEPPPTVRVRLRDRLRRAGRAGPWKLVFAIGLLQFGAHVAVPFFTPYMLRTLRLELDTFAFLTAVTIIGKAISLPIWGIFAGRVGLSVAMTLSVATISVVPAVWVWAETFPDLVLVQLLGGVGWAGFEYVSLQLLLGNAPKGSSVEFFSLSSALTGALQLAGSMTGSMLLNHGASYHTVFLASSILRAVPLILLTPVAASLGRGLRLQRLWLRLVSVRPTGGAERRPVVTDVEAQRSREN